ncbi:DMT family transporter [Paenibacillus sp. GCM10023250]|uniref:DMT family transporter n=1 Tax=Paenibacillus sp. GCM10023250 TaxID=3252648 RepID=UPI003611359F
MKRLKLYAMLAGFSVFTGASFDLAKYTAGYFSPLAAAAWRFGLAAPALLVLLHATEGIRFAPVRRNALAYAVLGIVGIFGFSALFFWGLRYTSPVNGALIMALNPLLTSVAGRFILKDRMSPRQAAGLGAALTGVAIVVLHGSPGAFRTLSFSAGDLLLFAANLCWTSYGVLGRRLVRGGSSLSTTAYSTLAGALCLIAAAQFAPSPAPLERVPPGSWGAIAFMAFFTSVLGYSWWNKGMAEIGAGPTSVFFNAVPVVTMAVSLADGMPVTAAQAVGALLVLSGVWTAAAPLPADRRGPAS